MSFSLRRPPAPPRLAFAQVFPHFEGLTTARRGAMFNTIGRRQNLPYFWDKSPDTLPQPELNPLTNPALERNLSRWAQAYFGNPPGKRELAISKLLQEIKSETSEILVAEQSRREASVKSLEITPSEINSPEINSPETQGVGCPSCHQQNPAGNKFCGQCGKALNASQSPFGNGSVSAVPVPPDSEVQWLRNRALGSLYETETPASHRWRYVLGSLALALAGFVYLQWASTHRTGVASPVTVAAPRQTPPLPAGNSSTPAAPQSPEAISSSPKPPAPQTSGVHAGVAIPEAQDARDRRALPAGVEPAAQKSSMLSAGPAPKAVASGEGGLADLRLAQRYLGGNTGARDSAEAAKLLWQAVRKQNTTAAVLLSELYARGDGVPKSCDQARLLLVAAARHGAPHAAEQLRDLESRGCQ